MLWSTGLFGLGLWLYPDSACRASSRAIPRFVRSLLTRECCLTSGTVFLRWLGTVMVASMVIAACASPSGSAPITTTSPVSSTTTADQTTVGTVNPSSTVTSISQATTDTSGAVGTPTTTPETTTTTRTPTTATPPPKTTTTTTPPNTTTQPQTPKTVTNSIVSFAFNPNPISINVGDTVRWTNNDPVDHTTTSLSNWDSGSLSLGASYSEVFESPGTFNYFCSIHPSMVATVVVNP